MLDFSLSDEQNMVRNSVRAFVDKEIISLETQVLRNEREGRPALEPGQLRDLQLKAKSAGFWGITIPKEYGGAGFGAIINSLINIECGRTFVPFKFGGHADNILFSGTESQKQEYLIPTIEASGSVASRLPSLTPARKPPQFVRVPYATATTGSSMARRP
ncbi:acyl-CoA dehydrogenase family protein [Bradyrhizobium sp. 23AC]